MVKTEGADREDLARRVRQAYRTLMRGLLDLTDNRQEGKIVSPPGLVAYDGADPYLVVAADKGTAAFSDTANEISAEYGFWLGDAFASGGSRGYDHKKLGITARGAWECVKRHFRELGIDIAGQPFTVVGIGDMSGDVFGNGMLLSRQIRLRAAFDHRHVFIDPDPDPEVSFRERQRLFALPRSSWADYDRALISAGGGVWSREAKEIPLSPPVRAWLGVRQTVIDAPGLIRLLLAAEVDLLWNGGIGTFFKASTEKEGEVGDRANDPLRIDAVELKARVVGEGGNLGFTQKGRIEYALAGGRINTDAVDNSAGVDCSDHEVNLKILMQRLLETGALAGGEERDRLLAEVADNVCAAVLANNYGQSLCLSLDQRRSALDVDSFLELADRLANAGLLDRRGESLPSAREIAARRERGLTRPELAILMAYSKMQLKQTLLERKLPRQEEFAGFLRDYFPPLIRDRFGADLPAHPLAAEIAATMIVNTLVDQAGSAFTHRLNRLTGADPARIVSAYFTFDQALDGREFRRRVALLDGLLGAERQYELLLALEETLASLCQWGLENGSALIPGSEQISATRRQAAEVFALLEQMPFEEITGLCSRQAEELEREGVPADLARTASRLSLLEDLLPIAALAEQTGFPIRSMATAFLELRRRLGLEEVRRLMVQVQARDRWDRLTLQTLQRRLAGLLRSLTLELCRETGGELEGYVGRHRAAFKSYQGFWEALRTGGTPANYHPFTVLLAALEELREKSPPGTGPGH